MLSKTLFTFALIVTFSINSSAQKLASTEAELDSIYAVNIKLSKINGVYIPRNMKDAFSRLIQLTPSESITSFKQAEEVEVCKKLHFGIGRWMIINWSFYEGSRFSHYLKEKGLLHPDDMAQFVLRTFHRNLLSKDLNEELIIKELAIERKKEAQYLINN